MINMWKLKKKKENKEDLPLDTWNDWVAKLPTLSVMLRVIVEIPAIDEDTNIMVLKLIDALTRAMLDEETSVEYGDVPPLIVNKNCIVLAMSMCTWYIGTMLTGLLTTTTIVV